MQSESATEVLKRLMAAANIASYRELCRQAQVTDWTIQQIRRDRLPSLRLEVLQKLAIALKIPIPNLLHEFGLTQSPQSGESTAAPQESGRDRLLALETEYQRLQTQLEQQEVHLLQRFQKEVMTTIEPWLLQWPTVVNAVEKTPDLPASRLVPLVQPLQNLLEQWDIAAIAPVGAEIPYDPQQHQLMNGEAEPGDVVKVRYAGFTQNGVLLYRAKVSPVE